MDKISAAPSIRLVPVSEGMDFIGAKSRTTYYKLVRDGELPPLIKRGIRSFHLESDLVAYVQNLVAARGGA